MGGDFRPIGLWVDNAGRFYTLRKESDILSVYVFDKDGKGICAYDKKSKRDTICMPIRDNIGRLLLPVIDESQKATQLLYLNEENQWSELVTIEDEAIEYEEFFAIERGEDPYGYISLMDNYKGELRALGYPSEDRKGNYLTVGNLLVVNAKVSEEKKEIIRGYIEHLLSPGVQLEISHERVNIIDGFFCDHVIFDERTERYYWEYQGMQTELHVEKLYVDEYKEMLENATVAIGDRDIINILGEELGPYLSGDQTALEVTGKIDNRVQLYLDENK